MKVPHFARLDETGFDRIVWTFAVFVLIGPPVGLLVLVTSYTFREGSAQAFAALPAAMPKLLEALPFAYFLGILPAAAAGLLVGACKVSTGRTTWWMALAIGIVVGLAFLYFIERPGAAPTPPPAPQLSFRAIIILTNVVPTMLCWAIVRNWFSVSPTRSVP